MQNSRTLWASLIAGLVAAVLFIGGVAGNLLANDLQIPLAHYRPLIWATCGIAFVVAVVTAIVAVRRNNQPIAVDKTRSVNASDERSAVAKAESTATLMGSALHQLRPPVGDFVGREQEIETLINALRRDSGACISGINGMGGIGKTELALYVAERLSTDYPDAQLFINLQGAEPNPRPPEQVLEICIRAFLGPEARLPEDLDQLSQLYRNQLNGKRVLLLLDNAADDKQVYPLLPPTGCALLVTSRETISLPGIKSFTLNPLPEEKARKLLLEIAPHAHPAAAQICKLCGYLPLAIRAAGSLLAITPDLDPVKYAVQLEDERNRLERIGAKGVERGVTASFNLSYARLAPEAARVFRLLSVFPGTFDAAAAEVVCDDEGHAYLSDLVRHSLVLYDASTKRYRLHDLARLFAKAKLGAEERPVGQKRFATHYKDVLATADELFLQGGDSLVRGLALFDLEWGNIQTGHAWVAAKDVMGDEDVIRLRMLYPDAGVYVLNLRQHSREQIRWLEIALDAAKRLRDREREGNVLGNLGSAHADLGETKRAIQFYEQRLSIAREIGDRRGEGTALGNLGSAYAEMGETKRAIQFFEQRLTIAREIGDRRAEAKTVANLGIAYANLNETNHAIQLYEQAMVIAREIGDRRGEGADLINLGTAYRNMGETKRAIQFYEQALVIARQIGDRRGEGQVLGNLGIVYDDLGETKRAVQFYETALLIDREIDNRRGEFTNLWNLSLALDKLGKRAQAIECAEQSLIIREQIEDLKAEMVRAQLAEWRAS